MDFDRHCAEIVTQTELLATESADADLASPVPSCPGWTLGNLVRHLGGGHRWAEEIVRTRATAPLPDDRVRQVDGDDSGPLPGSWLVEGASRLASALREAGPDAEVWVPFHYGTASFYARRFTHETLVHRADATLAAGLKFRAAPEVVLDAVDEWMELEALPQHFEFRPEKREILGEGRSVGFEAAEHAWFLDLTGSVVAWERGRREAAATVRGSLTDLLLVLYQRKDADEVVGDREFFERWQTHVRFG
ncbi:maleylpyruvate isomerase family mycothiol-dependent enzyme [Amycolatopsis pittospori]|uniref:maleylpyruvate isomerase family mycothiol-dependent enzyme n=1 Tax=Amycolatopsis pittospori TaxID=2749434 RepID=UPI0015F0735B|nr:maleylpyruvate isomerase family mycothiol-dependent enzyme [Amycolatopsis pittospori]